MDIQPPPVPTIPPPHLTPPAVPGDDETPGRTSAGQAWPLTPEQMQAVAQANQRARKLRSAAGVAFLNAICLGTFSGLSLLVVVGEAAFGGFDWLGVIMGLGLGVLCWNELRGRALLRRFDTRAPAVLGWNQLALLGLIVAYAAWMIGVAMFGPNPYEQAMRTEPQVAQVLGNIGNLYKTLAIMVYGALIAGTFIFQGLTARYYFTRAKLLRTYLTETPAWIVELQRRQAT